MPTASTTRLATRKRTSRRRFELMSSSGGGSVRMWSVREELSTGGAVTALAELGARAEIGEEAGGCRGIDGGTASGEGGGIIAGRGDATATTGAMTALGESSTGTRLGGGGGGAGEGAERAAGREEGGG